jgi:hypothetical protein
MIRHLVSAATVLFGAVVLSVGCGGASPSTITDTGSLDGGGSGDGATTGTATDGGAGTGTGGGNGLLDGGGNGPGGDTTTIPCGNSACSVATQVCCILTLNNVTVSECATGSCLNLDAGLGQGGGNGNVAALKCTSQANCAAGSICCVHSSQQGTSSECVVGNSCQNGAQLCDPSAMPTGCPTNGGRSKCSSDKIGDWGLAPPFATCGGVGN